MNEEEQTKAKQGDSARQGPEPFIAGISDGVNAGYEALEYVLAAVCVVLLTSTVPTVAAVSPFTPVIEVTVAVCASPL